jgi:hypothetical protein
MWTYSIPTGVMYDPQGKVAGVGYAGAPGYINDPSEVSIKDKGPLPPGMYTITNWRTDKHMGPLCASLVQDSENQMYGRSGFNLHGDKIDHPGCGSEGCIQQIYPVRLRMSKSDDNRLKATLEEEPFGTADTNPIS